jgi:hypothetical protein
LLGGFSLQKYLVKKTFFSKTGTSFLILPRWPTSWGAVMMVLNAIGGQWQTIGLYHCNSWVGLWWLENPAKAICGASI